MLKKNKMSVYNYCIYSLQNLVLCFRLHFTKDSPSVINTAGATVRQLVALVFERVLHEDEQLEQQFKDNPPGINNENNAYDQYQQNGTDDVPVPVQDHRSHHNYQYNSSSNTYSSDNISATVAALGPCAADAYLMFQVWSSIIKK